ncbi:MAG: hypothetical protein WAK55_17430 [Xanthobacteraceae bacterium]
MGGLKLHDITSGGNMSGSLQGTGGSINLPGAPPPNPTPNARVSPQLRSAIDSLVFRHGRDEPNASPLIAYRAWNVTGGRLCSVGVGPVAWPARRVYEAVCQAERSGSGLSIPAHNAPHPECTCGLYGFATVASLEQVMDSAVLGRVSLGGEVVVCADREPSPIPGEGGDGTTPILGYRAQAAYPSLLYLWEQERNRDGSPSCENCGHCDDCQTADNRVNVRSNSDRNARIRQLADAYGIEVAPLPQPLLDVLRRRRDAAMLSTRNAFNAQSALLAQMYAQQQQNAGYGLSAMGQSTAPPSPYTAGTYTVSGPPPTMTPSPLTGLQQAYPNATAMGLLLPNGGGPGLPPGAGVSGSYLDAITRLLKGE